MHVLQTAKSPVFLQIYDALPMLRSLPLPFKKVFDNYSTLKTLTTNMVNKHKTTRVPGKPRDFVDYYLDELDKVWICVMKCVLFCFFGTKPC